MPSAAANLKATLLIAIGSAAALSGCDTEDKTPADSAVSSTSTDSGGTTDGGTTDGGTTDGGTTDGGTTDGGTTDGGTTDGGTTLPDVPAADYPLCDEDTAPEDEFSRCCVNVYCYTPPEGAECPSAEDITSSQLASGDDSSNITARMCVDPDGPYNMESAADYTFELGDCCYVAGLQFGEGRPLLIAGAIRVAPLRRGRWGARRA